MQIDEDPACRVHAPESDACPLPSSIAREPRGRAARAPPIVCLDVASRAWDYTPQCFLTGHKTIF